MDFLQRSNIIEVFRKSGWFIAAVSLFFVLFFIMQLINHRFWLHDYEVFYSAANSYLKGRQVYGIAHGLSSGYYKYSPFALIVFLPFSLLPFFVAKVFHFILLSSFIITCILLSADLTSHYFFGQREKQKNNLLVFIIFLPLLPNIYTELHLGNINIILLFIFLTALRYLLAGKDVKAGILIAAGILFKPHFIVFIPLLLIRKKFRTTATIFAGLAAGILLPAVYTGITHNNLLHHEWMLTMQTHNNSLIGGQDTIYSWFYRSIGQFLYPDVINHDKAFGMLLLLIIALLFIIMILFHYRNEKANNIIAMKQNNFIFEYILLLAIIPNITVTDSEHFLLSIPLIAFATNWLFKQKEHLIIKIVGVSCFVLYGMNMREVVGTNCSAWLTTNGILGIANLAIIAYCIYIYRVLNKKKI
jgi:hypothetical protein